MGGYWQRIALSGMHDVLRLKVSSLWGFSLGYVQRKKPKRNKLNKLILESR